MWHAFLRLMNALNNSLLDESDKGAVVMALPGCGVFPFACHYFDVGKEEGSNPDWANKSYQTYYYRITEDN